MWCASGLRRGACVLVGTVLWATRAIADEPHDIEDGATPPPPPAEETPAEEEADDDGLTTETWKEPPVPPAWHWDVLRLPETATRLATTPLIPFIKLVQDTRLHLRVYDALTNDEGTLLVLPIFVAATSDGVGGGLRIFRSDLFGAKINSNAGGVVKRNRDFSTSAGLSKRFPRLDGRKGSTGIGYSVDRNERFYDIGGNSRLEDERRFREDKLRVRGNFELLGRQQGSISTTTGLSLVYRRFEIGPGTGGIPAGLPGDTVAPPAGFGDTNHVVDVGWNFGFDARNTRGRTAYGSKIKVKVDAARSVDDDELSAIGAEARVTGYIPLAPQQRTLVLSVGGGAVRPWSDDDQVPLDNLIALGRRKQLRGYKSDRFYGNVGWWGTVEYRYPIFTYRDRSAGLSSTLFFDVGRVGVDVQEAFELPIRYSYGFGIRADSLNLFVFRIQVGFSPEGAEIAFSLNEGL